MKIFTVEEANALLPTARKILVRLQAAYREVLSHSEETKRAATAAEEGGGGISSGVRYASALIKLTHQMSELDVLGVQLKDFQRGLIDFPSLRDGRVVLLCWQVGDGDQVEWWHDVDAGFAGRTPL